MIKILKNRPYTPKDRDKWVKQLKKDKPVKENQVAEEGLVIAEPD
jgi:predicted secreted acid phosphatase